ncbi:MAG: hypothetical protein ABFD64_08460 [Armatimonadota bacterium]
MNEHEDKTVSSFITREKRHRFRYFMDNPKIRSKELNCLNHTHVLEPSHTVWLSQREDIKALLRKEGSPENVYIISGDERIDGSTRSLSDAIEQIVESGWGAIISCIPGKLAYYRDECGERHALLKM